uniref:Lipoprotein n=1 Tax=Dictyoglomus turgidum TaxID=513050 RepID=A0A7C3WM03_9BACT
MKNYLFLLSLVLLACNSKVNNQQTNDGITEIIEVEDKSEVVTFTSVVYNGLSNPFCPTIPDEVVIPGNLVNCGSESIIKYEGSNDRFELKEGSPVSLTVKCGDKLKIFFGVVSMDAENGIYNMYYNFIHEGKVHTVKFADTKCK